MSSARAGEPRWPGGHQAERAELVFLAFPVCRPSSPRWPWKILRGQPVLGFLDGELAVHAPPVTFVGGVGEGEQVQGLGDPPVFGECLAQRAGVATRAHRPGSGMPVMRGPVGRRPGGVLVPTPPPRGACRRRRRRVPPPCAGGFGPVNIRLHGTCEECGQALVLARGTVRVVPR